MHPVISPPSRWRQFGQACLPTFRYMMQTEAHVYAFSVGANILLSAVPFLIVMVSLCRQVFHWEAAVGGIYVALQDYFPGSVAQSIQSTVNSAGRRGTFQIASILLLLFTANGVFEPLEVALNRVWGVRKHRSFLGNQLISLCLIFACGALFLVSVTMTAMNRNLLLPYFGKNAGLMTVLTATAFKLAALPASVLALFLIYWLLPNRSIQPRAVVPVAVVVGLILECLKYVNLLLWPYFRAKLQREYGFQFISAVALVFWGFAVAMVILSGAEWASRPYVDRHGVTRTRWRPLPTPPPRPPSRSTRDAINTEAR